MVEASGLLAEARSARQLSMNTLADISGVPASTISRIESGKIEPTWSMMARILTAAGFRFEPTLTDADTDEPFAGIIRRLDAASPDERRKIIGRFPAVAGLALVARRAGARRVQLDTEVGEVVSVLDEQNQAPVVSSLEAYAGDIGQTRSFFPVIYVNDPAVVRGFTQASPTSPAVLFLLPTTDNVRATVRDRDGVAMVSREWALLDSLASPGRQPDVSMYLLDDLSESPQRLEAGDGSNGPGC